MDDFIGEHLLDAAGNFQSIKFQKVMVTLKINVKKMGKLMLLQELPLLVMECKQ